MNQRTDGQLRSALWIGEQVAVKASNEIRRRDLARLQEALKAHGADCRCGGVDYGWLEDLLKELQKELEGQ